MVLQSLQVVMVVSLGVGRAAAEPAAADTFVRAQVDQLADVLAGGAADQFDVLRTRVRDVADFDGFAKKALGKTWAGLSADEQKRFKAAMQELLESHYMNKPGAIFDKKKLTVTGATVVGEITEVTTSVKRKDVDIGVVVRLELGPTTWIVEDVVIDGLSLLEDYRSQFATYLKKKTIGELIDKLKSKAKANLAKK